MECADLAGRALRSLRVLFHAALSLPSQGEIVKEAGEKELQRLHKEDPVSFLPASPPTDAPFWILRGRPSALSSVSHACLTDPAEAPCRRLSFLLPQSMIRRIEKAKAAATAADYQASILAQAKSKQEK